MNLTAEQLYNLFIHRKDVFSEQHPSGAYFPSKRPITMEDIQEHLEGKKTIGVYCLNTDNTVKWACIDLDGADLRQLELEAEEVYSLFPIKQFGKILEKSGRRGFHVWVFFKTPIPALYAQKIIKSYLNRVGMLKYEVFPKQTELNEGRKYGNLVKLPLGIHQKTGKRTEILKMEGL